MSDDSTTPVQAEIENKTPPPVRARVSIYQDKQLSPGAKFFGAWIIDTTFNFWSGGDGKGRLTIGVKDIRALIGHDKKSITRWHKELHHHIWVEQHKIPNAYPVNVYCVRELISGQKQMEINGLARAWGRATGEQGKFSSPPFLPHEGMSTSQTPLKPPTETPIVPLIEPHSATSQAAKCHLPGPKNATSQAARLPLEGGRNGSGEVASLPLRGGRNGSGEAAETGHFKETPLENRRLKDMEEALPTEKQFQAWNKSLDGLFPSRLRDLEKAFTKKLALAKSPDAKAEWKRRLTTVQDKLLGGPVQDKATKSVRVERKPTMTFEQRREAWEKAKAGLDPSLKQKAAGKAAART